MYRAFTYGETGSNVLSDCPRATQQETGSELGTFNSIAHAFNCHTNPAPPTLLLKSQGPQLQNDDKNMLQRLSQGLQEITHLEELRQCLAHTSNLSVTISISVVQYRS